MTNGARSNAKKAVLHPDGQRSAAITWSSARGSTRLDHGPAVDADELRRYVNEITGENTANRTCGRAKQFFRAAVRKKLIPDSPFGDMKGVDVKPNRSRDFYVTRKMAAAVSEPTGHS
jgi:hypothetical protein